MLADELTFLADLLEPRAYPHPVEQVEAVSTHISQLFLAGDFAYKLKRPVSLGFVDFSTLERRRFYCEEELRLNRRLAPQLYLDVVQVVRQDARLRIDAEGEGEGEGETIDYAVRMHRFPQQALLSKQPLDEALIDRLAERVAYFHASLMPAPADTPYGEPEAVLAPMLDNFEPLRAAIAARDTSHAPATRPMPPMPLMSRSHAICSVSSGGPASDSRACAPRSSSASAGGHIRECHGDMHRGNIVVLDGEPVIFDCIEFNPSLRWIDTMSEVAFLTMDLAESGAHGLARRLLNRYLEVSGDYDGLRLLRFYQVYRALVRAKVSAIQLLQTAPASEQEAAPADARQSRPEAMQARAQARQEMQHYLALARSCTGRHRPQLFITHGFSGSGKTRLGHLLREQLPIIQIRSDIERKRLYGIPEQSRPPAHQDVPLYGHEATARTYRRLLALARESMAAGFSVLVDATFLSRAQRAPFLALAEALHCPYRILALQAPMPLLRERINARGSAGQDASDADLDVLSLQIAQCEPLTEAEHRSAVFLNTAAPMQIEAVLARITGHHRPNN